VATWQWLLSNAEDVRGQVEAYLGKSSAQWTMGEPASQAGDKSTSDTPSPSSSADNGDEEYEEDAEHSALTGAADFLSGAGVGGSMPTGSPEWPVLMEGDGSKSVAVMQRALGAAGFYCGEDDLLWWQAGSDTINALRTFQARCKRIHLA
jgi:hypothetical protein